MVLTPEEIVFRADIELDKFRKKIEIMKAKTRELSEMKELRTAIKNQKVFSRRWDEINSRVASARNQINHFSKGHRTFGSVMGENEELLRKFNKAGGKFQTRSAKAAMGIRKFATGLRGFRMEMLSVMFFGLGMQRFFSGLLSPALELTGVFELFTTTLQLLFLPIALFLLENVAIPLLNFFLNMSDKTKMFIGWLAILGVALGAGLFIFGMLVLALGGIIAAFGGLFLIIDKLIPDVNVLGVNMSSFLEAGIGITAVTSLWDIFKGTIGGLVNKFFELDFVKKWLDEHNIQITDAKSTWDKLKSLWAGIKQKLDFQLTFTVAGESLTRPLSWWIDFYTLRFRQFIKDMKEKIEEKMDFTTFKEMATHLESIGKLAQTILDIINKIKSAGNWFNQTFSQPGMLEEMIAPSSYGTGGSWTTNNESFTSSPTININTTGGVDSFSLAQIQEIIARELASISRR